ncbi:MAG: CBS domain-containing protein [Microcoleus sp. PH2017_10_PVI_O_A]|uniref:CBS domain-containing protein n=1 Tax=unclassified Microcoleus TaxID=2642155 RepID=UPI001D50DE9F|nr:MULTISPECIES: CBS domain-containing protein [unclassified Microcoleus]TAE85652.1 MAG: CBS domain-containing protein [Oscillatoriales cyanobacterium]MCC3405028.1 CBS domain-containing protein [Microcoleus sp. PH2017_10_PVI_O_A]MCC3459108.1 CBS domain-containing protein [Microcoleus sp. PH2017_11_PCY_U_A]MCC3477165.1 CBS domain-containing protein [Microcoleus sp. PH2017_12_PCY_D_A]MCC3527717.1 CBS domain-containing protein [Microcoleus sp. PH2017_21_RUC_O_A]
MSITVSDSQSFLEQAIAKPPVLPPDTPLKVAIAAMTEARASCILIAFDRQLIGIFTERDVVKITASEIPLAGMAIAEVMTQNPIAISLDNAGNIFKILSILRSAKIRHLPVTDNSGNLLGAITGESIRQILKPGDLLQMRRAEEIMTAEVIVASTNTSVLEVAKQMATQRKSCIVICNECDNNNQKPVGIITERDIVKFQAAGLDFAGTRAAAAMSFPLMPLQAKATLWEAHQFMQEHRIRRLVVVDEGGYLAGIVTQSTLLHALDPVEMHANVELLQETVAENLLELKKVNEQLQKEALRRTEIEEQLRLLNENLEEQIKLRTLELINTNSQLKKEIQDRATAEAEVRRLNTELEQRVLERTVQLAASNQELQQEISDRQLLEEKLHFSESKVRAVFEAMTDIVMVLDSQGNIEVLPTNTAAVYEPDCDLVSLTVEHFFDDDNPDDWWMLVLQVLETQQTVNFDYSLTVGDREIWFYACISLFSKDAVIWVARNISARKLAESALSQKNAELAHTLEELKRTQQELIQSEKMAALGQLIAGVAHEINSPLGAIRSSVQNIADFWAEQLQQLPIFFQQLSPERQHDFFALLYNSSTETDNLSSKEKRQLKKLLQRQLESEKIDDADSLACTLLDIGISSNNLESFLPLLKDSTSPNILKIAYEFATVQKSTKNIVTATDRAAKIVFALKSYSRYDQSGSKAIANITDGIDTVLTLYHYQIKHGVEVVRNYGNDLPSVLCYPDELNQVWTNLLHNALQAMGNKGVLKIDVKHEDNAISVCITDSGPGIPPEIMPRIFEPFFTTKPPGEGSGLGLDIVHKIIKKHQGKLQVESVPGQTQFTVFLPLEQDLRIDPPNPP